MFDSLRRPQAKPDPSPAPASRSRRPLINAAWAQPRLAQPADALEQERYFEVNQIVNETTNGLTGIVAGLLFYSLTNYERLRRNLIRNRLRTIAEMNHHIRNSLQVITYANTAQKNAESVKMIRSSVERIEWALREVLPGHVEVPATPPEHVAEENEALRTS